MLPFHQKLLYMFIFISFASCEQLSEEEKTRISSDLIFYNGSIYTVNKENPWVEAIVIKDGKISALGKTDSILAVYKSHQAIDLKGTFMMPGIHDSHIHALESGSVNNHFGLSEAETNPENYALVIKNSSSEHAGLNWLRGYGHSLHTLLKATRSPKLIIDEVVSNRPVIIMEQTSHSMWVNSKALEVAGITKDTPNPIGGIIMKDEMGEPTGVLIDNAGNIVMDIAMKTTPKILENDYLGLTEWMLPELAKHGITSITEARSYWKRDHHKTWKRLEENGKLTLRVNLALWAYPEENDVVQINSLKSLYDYKKDKLLKINQIKFYSDGIIHNTTSAMKTNYLIDLFGEKTNNGLNYFTETRLSHYLSQLDKVGFGFHIHAIGNRGITESLNAIEQNGTSKGRHKLTHLEFVSPSDYPRFNQLNVTADCQVAGEFTKPEYWHENAEYIGAKASTNIIPLKSLNAAHANVTLSSDYSVSTYNPFAGLQNAITRKPQELSLTNAIEAYTINSAYSMRQDDVVGSIEIGKEADLIILDQHLFEIDETQISKTRVLLTLLKGKAVYKTASFSEIR